MRQALRSGAKGPRVFALALLACALALRFLVPVGWMPVSDARGVHLILCPAAGPDMPPMAMHHAMAGMHGSESTPQHDQTTQDHACPFAGLGLALAEPALPAATAPALPAEAAAIPAHPFAVAIGRGLAAPPPPATGPPSLG